MKLNWINEEVILNLHKFICQGEDYIILDMSSRDLPSYKLLSEFNTFAPSEIAGHLPFDDIYKYHESYVAMGVYFTSDYGEFLKLMIPKGIPSVDLYTESNQHVLTIEFGNDNKVEELENDKVVVLSSVKEVPLSSGNNQYECNSIYIAHALIDKKPHLDTFLSVNLGHSKLQCHKLLINKSFLNAGVIGNTYIDSSGRFFYLGDSYDL